jgi:hypothetical protein
VRFGVRIRQRNIGGALDVGLLDFLPRSIEDRCLAQALGGGCHRAQPFQASIALIS